jgi:ribose transport system substrate-binding protein
MVEMIDNRLPAISPTGAAPRRRGIARVIPVALAVVLVLGSVAASRWTAPAVQAKSITLGFVLPDLQNPIFVPMRTGANDASKKFGFSLKLVGPTSGDVQGQISLMQDLVQEKVNGIIVVPADATGLNTSINKAISAGIPVATANLDAPGSNRAFYYGPNAKLEGQLEAKRVMTWLHTHHKTGTINYVITSCLPSVTGQLDRRAGFEQTVKNKNPYKGQFHLAEIGFYNTTTDPVKNLANVKNIYTAKKSSMQVVYAMCAPDTENWGKTVKQAGDHNLLIAGHDWLPQTLNLIGSGWIPWSLGESPYDMGYTSLKYMYQHAANGAALPHGILFARSIFATKANLAQIRKSPDAKGG